jgi:nucleoside-diphosphate-sugar epimerase
MINSINKNIEMIIYNNGNQIRDMLFVEDAAKGIIQAIKNSQKEFSIFNISSSKRYTVKEIIEMVEKISRHKIPIKFSSEMPDEKILSTDNSIAQKVLQFKPCIDIEEGLKITVNDLLKK